MDKIENIDFVVCPICNKQFKRLAGSGHLQKHSITTEEFKKLYPEQILFCESYGKKLSERQIGKTYTEETKKKMSEGTKGQIVSYEQRRKISKSLTGIKRSEETKEKIRQANLGKKYSKELRQKLSKSHIGQKSTKKGKTFDEFYGESRSIKIRELMSKKARIQKIISMERNYGILFPNYNLKACKWFKLYDKTYNTLGKYAVYGGGEYCIKELGYWVDYINFDKKIIIEWDEPHHYDAFGNIRSIDVKRQKRIQELFHDFKFIRINEAILHEETKRYMGQTS